VKTPHMDCGFKIQEAQGPKSLKQDLSVIIFDSRVDGGLIPRKPGGSLTKEAAEALSSILDRWIKIGRLRLDPSRERVSADLDARIKIGRLKGDLGLAFTRSTGSKSGG
jgi:hypothetical protein